MRNALQMSLFPFSAMLVIACSAATEPEPLPSADGDAELALTASADDDAAPTEGLDASRRGQRAEGRGHRHGRHHHGHGGGTPPPPPVGQSCEVAGQTFPDGGAVPSGDSCNTCGCNDGGVICTLALCEPVVCAAFVEAPDGVCSRFPLDPCKTQDPDCVTPNEPAAP
jgi:hypothetical protein